MTNQEAIKILDNLKPGDYSNPYEKGEAIVMAISALQAQDEEQREEPLYCDRDICLRNEYNRIGCEECEVTKSQKNLQQVTTDTISRREAIDVMCELMHHWFGGDPKDEIREIKRELENLPSAQPQYTELTPEEAASEIASGSTMSAWYWLDDMIRLKQMGYAICRKR